MDVNSEPLSQSPGYDKIETRIRRLLPTPTASLANYAEEPENWLHREKHKTARRRKVGSSSMPLPIAVKLLSTPQARDGRPDGSQNVPSHQGSGTSLMKDLVLLPTPSTRHESRGHKLDGSRYTETSGTTLLDALYESSGVHTSPQFTAGPGSSAGLTLSPWFVEWMMGAPEGWSDPGCPLSATEFSSRQAGSQDGGS